MTIKGLVVAKQLLKTPGTAISIIFPELTEIFPGAINLPAEPFEPISLGDEVDITVSKAEKKSTLITSPFRKN